MKEYRKNNRIIDGVIVLAGAICSLEFYFDEWFPWLTKLDFALFICVIVVVCFTPVKYYCGVVSVRITEKAIERKWLFVKTCTISRDSAVAFPHSIGGVLCMIFSTSDLPLHRTSDILRAVFKRKAIVFPYVHQIKQDFPELFR